MGDAAGYCVMALPIVPQGFRQRILSVVVGGVTFQATAKGNCALFVSGAPPLTDTAVPTSWVRGFVATLPNTFLFNEYQLIVPKGSFLGIQIFDSTFAADQYVANITSLLEPETAALFRTGARLMNTALRVAIAAQAPNRVVQAALLVGSYGESGWDPTAVSPGAYGAFQFTPPGNYGPGSEVGASPAAQVAAILAEYVAVAAKVPPNLTGAAAGRVDSARCRAARVLRGGPGHHRGDQRPYHLWCQQFLCRPELGDHRSHNGYRQRRHHGPCPDSGRPVLRAGDLQRQHGLAQDEHRYRGRLCRRRLPLPDRPSGDRPASRLGNPYRTLTRFCPQRRLPGHPTITVRLRIPWFIYS